MPLKENSCISKFITRVSLRANVHSLHLLGKNKGRQWVRSQLFPGTFVTHERDSLDMVMGKKSSPLSASLPFALNVFTECLTSISQLLSGQTSEQKCIIVASLAKLLLTAAVDCKVHPCLKFIEGVVYQKLYFNCCAPEYEAIRFACQLFMEGN